MKKQDPIRKSMGLPFALCDECAKLFTAALPLRKVSEHREGIAALANGDGMVVCANCRKRRPGAEYRKEG